MPTIFFLKSRFWKRKSKRNLNCLNQDRLNFVDAIEMPTSVCIDFFANHFGNACSSAGRYTKKEIKKALLKNWKLFFLEQN